MRARGLLAAGLIAAAAGGGADWPQFRGPAGSGVAADKLPTEWSADRHIAWKATVPGVGWACPIVVGGKVFVATAVADGQPKPGGPPPPGGGERPGGPDKMLSLIHI